MYRDPDICLQSHPGRISAAMLRQVSAALDRITWGRGDVERFIGTYLTEPKPHIFFTPPPHPRDERDFAYQVARTGLELNLKSRMLWKKKNIFINGENYRAGAASCGLLKRLADNLALSTTEELDSETLALLYEWYLAGYVDLPPSKNDEFGVINLAVTAMFSRSTCYL